MIHQLNLEGKDKVDIAIDRLQNFAEVFKDDKGFFLAFSGGKDSVTIKKLADMAGVKYDAHYSITSVDPPELVWFIKREHPDVQISRQHWAKDGVYVKEGDPITMWNLISENVMPPTRSARYCCEKLKESAGDGRLIITGVRWAESHNRKANQGLVTIRSGGKKLKKQIDEMGADYRENQKGGVILNEDNTETREVVEYCYQRRVTVLNPIIDWTDDEVWEFIHEYNVPYCELYDKGYKRLGCIGCPMNSNAAAELERYPKYKAAYIRAFEKMLNNGHEKTWRTADEVYKWWTLQWRKAWEGRDDTQ